jgi:hypothetical protein
MLSKIGLVQADVILYHRLMDGLVRLLGSGASLSATALQLAVIVATWPVLPECGRSLCLPGGEPGLVELLIGWEPFIDNEGVGTQASNEPRCLGPQTAGSRFRLDHAPLPPGFDPHAYPNSDMLACVKLGADGSVEAVRIVAGTGRTRLDARLLGAIYRKWRFRPVDGAGDGKAWQRVRLNTGYRDAPQLALPPAPRPPL